MVGPGELAEVPAGDFDDHVVQRRLEEGRGGLGDLVLEFGQGIAQGQFGGDLGDGVAGGLTGQGRGAAHPGVDLDHDELLRFRVLAELDVAAAGEVAHGAHGVDGLVAHVLVGRVAQGHGRGHGHRIPGVDAHGVEVLHRADDDDVVGRVAQQFQFELLPAQDGLVDEDLVGGAGVQPAAQHVGVVLLLKTKTPAEAAEGIRGSNDEGEADLLGGLHAFQEAVGDLGRGTLQADLLHVEAEELAVLGQVDGVQVDADELGAVLLPQAEFAALDGQVQGRLPAHRRQDGVDLGLLAQNLLDGLRRQRQQVDVVGRHRVGHDGGRVGVDDGHLDALLAQAAAGLAAGVVEFTGLADDDGAGADDEYGGYAGILWHASGSGGVV